MKFTCEKALLQSAIATAARAVSPKSSIPALEGILITADQILTLSGYNMATGIRTRVPAEIREEGSIVLGARLFFDIIRKLEDDIVVFESGKDMNVSIRCGISEFNILGTAAEDFPDLPEVEDKFSAVMEQGRLKSMIAQTLFAVSDNESRPIHTGSLFEFDYDNLTLVSVDGYRLALRREPVKKLESLPFSCVVPGSALAEVERIANDTEDRLDITLGLRHVQFLIGETELICRRLDGEFLDYKKAVSRDNPIKLKADRRKLLTCIDRISPLITDKLKSPVRCTFSQNLVKLQTNTAIGSAYDECAIQGDGEELVIGFNNRYLLDALKAASTDEIVIELKSGVSPCIMVPAEGEESFLYMVLPVRLRAGE